MATTNTESIILGSGKLYYKEFTGTVPTRTEMELPANIFGFISGGASIEYKPTYYTAKDDLGLVQKTIVTDEEATLKTGIVTLNGKTIEIMCNTARVTETASKRTVKIGGVGNDNGKSYAFMFVHEDAIDGDVSLLVVGKNQAGFTLAFAKDKETIVDAEIKAEPCDDDGTLIIYEEEIIA